MGLAEKSRSLLTRDLVVYGAKLLTSAIIARTLGPQIMGIWIILMLLPSYAEAIGRLKVDVGAVYFLGTGKYRLGEVSFMLMVLSLLSSGILLLIAFWNIRWIESYLFPGTKVSRYVISAVLASIPLNFLSLNFSYLLIHLEDIRNYNWLVILRSLVPSVLGAFFLLFFPWKLSALVTAMLLALCVSTAFGFWRTWRYEVMQPNFNFKMIKEMIAYGMNSYLAGLIGQVNAYFSGLILVRFAIPSKTGFFRMGQDATLLASRIPEALNTILYPRISKTSPSQADSQNLTARACRVSVVLMCCVGIAGVLGIYPMIYILYGTRYVPMAVPFLIILPGVLALGCTEPVSQYFMGTGRANILLRLSLIPLVTQIIVSLVLIPLWGGVGASLATTMTFVAMASARAAVFLHLDHLSFWRVFMPRREDFREVVGFGRSTLGSWWAKASIVIG